MIGIKVNGEFLDLFPDTRISLKLRNPIFAEGNIIPGSYSLPFEIPCEDLNPYNDRILEHPAEVCRHERKKVHKDVIIYFDGNQLKKGNLIINNVEKGVASCNFQFGLASVSEELKSVYVKDIIAEEIVLNAATYTKKAQVAVNSNWNFNGVSSPMSITVNGKDYEQEAASAADMIQGLTDQINANEEAPLAKATFFSSGFNGGTEPYMELEPLFDPTNLETPFSVAQPTGNSPQDINFHVLTNSEEYLQPIADSVNAYISATPPDGKIRFPVVFNQAISPIWQAAKPGEQRTRKPPDIMMNNQLDGTLKLNVYRSTITADINLTFYAENFTSLAPFLKLKHVIDSIAAYFNISIEGDFLSTEDYTKALIFPQDTLDSKQLYVGESEFIFWRPSFNLSELVSPDLKAIDLLKALQTRYSLAIYYDEDRRMLTLNTREQILTNRNYTDITKKVSPPQNIEESFKEGIKLEAETEKDDEFASQDEYSVGMEEELVIKTPVSGILSIKSFPEVPQVSIEYPVKSIRFVFEHGIVTETKEEGARSTTEVTYYKATNSLSHTNDFEGLYTIFWKQFLRFLMRRRKVHFEAALTLHDIMNVNWERKIRAGEVNYLLDEMSVTLSPKGINPAQLSLFSTD
jgi:hypothetical protein